MSKRYCISFLIVGSLLHFSLFAQTYNVSIKHFGVEDGLSNRFVNHIFQDSKGFIWIATNHGMNRYDGYQFKVYNDLEDYKYAFEDESGDIWMIRNYSGQGKDIRSYIDILNGSTHQLLSFGEKVRGWPDSLSLAMVINNSWKISCFDEMWL